jgi:hypothetical protein
MVQCYGANRGAAFGLWTIMAKKLNIGNLRTITSVAILVGTEILAASLALGWALGGLLELSETLRLVLILTCLRELCAFCFHASCDADRADPDRVNEDRAGGFLRASTSSAWGILTLGTS